MKNCFKLASLILGTLIFTQPTHALVGTSIKGGGAFSKLSSGSDLSALNTEYGMGYLVGLGVDVGLGPIGVSTEALYSHRKFGEDSSANSIYIPVQLRYSAIPMFFVSAGAFYALGLSEASDDFGIVAGLGTNLPAGLILEARYNFGLKNLSPLASITSKTRSFDLIAGYSF